MSDGRGKLIFMSLWNFMTWVLLVALTQVFSSEPFTPRHMWLVLGFAFAVMAGNISGELIFGKRGDA